MDEPGRRDAPGAAASPSWPADGGVTGHHWLLDLSGCRGPRALLEDAAALRRACVEAASQAGMRVVGDAFHQFAPAGVTGVVLLAESHLSVHTWPESSFAAIDVYVCDHDRVNHARGQRLARAMVELFRPHAASRRRVSRRSAASPSPAPMPA